MSDINIGKLRNNCFRQSKVAGEFMLQLRVPGAVIDAKWLELVSYICNTWGNGSFHLGMRQTLNVPGIKAENIPAVNEYIRPYLDAIERDMCDVKMDTSNGYPFIGPRNIMACIGGIHCIKGNVNTQEMAHKIEKLVYPNPYHIKVSIAGCPNDCAKVRMHDFGIMGMTEPQYRAERCVSCGACEKACKRKSVGALSMVNYRIQRNHEKCIGCGECVIQCPTRAWVRSDKKYYRLTLLGRTGKKNPRLGEDFIKWADEESILKIITNTYDYVREYIDLSAPGGKEHIGYIVDRTGFEEFKKWALRGVDLPEIAEVSERIYWGGVKY